MPKIVDHDERRETLCLAAAKLIHAQGLEAATVRAIARFAGCSTGVLAHYFADKDDLVAHVLAFVNRRPMERVLARIQLGTTEATLPDSAASLAPWIDEALPLDEERRMEWSVRLAIWGFRPNLQSFAPSGERSWLDAAADLVELGKAHGVVPAHLDSHRLAGQLIASIMGASLCTILDPARFDADWLRAQVARTLEESFAPVSTTGAARTSSFPRHELT
jgi:TetR/AcrR family transcriptional repressor of bet genes